MKNFKYCNIDFYLESKKILFDESGSISCKEIIFYPNKYQYEDQNQIFSLFTYNNNQYILSLECIKFYLLDRRKINTKILFDFCNYYYQSQHLLQNKFGSKYKYQYEFSKIFLEEPYSYEDRDEPSEFKQKIIDFGELILISKDIIKIYEKYECLAKTIELFR